MGLCRGWCGLGDNYCGLRLFYNVVVRCLVVFMKVFVVCDVFGIYLCVCGVCKGDVIRWLV